MGRQLLPIEGCRILVVEDDFLIAADLKQLIEGAGGAVVGPVSSNAAALWLTDTEEFDLAVLDVELNDGTATDLAHLFTRRGLPFVVVTGHDREMLSGDLVEAPFLQKPVGPADLIEVLARQRHPWR